MKHWSVPLLIMIVMICLMTGRLQSAPEQDTSAVNVKMLLKRIEQLEKRVDQLEKSRAVTVLPTQPQVLFQEPGRGLSSQPTVPESWKENQINGMKYYIVPLEVSKNRIDIHGNCPHRIEIPRRTDAAHRLE